MSEENGSKKGKKRVLIVGLACLDIINIIDHHPEEDEDLRALSQRWQKGGNAANTAAILSHTLGVDCELFCSFNTGIEGQFVRQELQRKGVFTPNCILNEDCGFPTSCVFINCNTGSRTIIHAHNDLPELSFSHFDKLDLSLYTWIHFEGRRNEAEISKMIKKIKDFNSTQNYDITISAELEKKRHELRILLDLPDVVFIGKDYAQYLGHNSPEETVKSLSTQVHRGTTLICPWGELGAVAQVYDGKLYTSPAFPPDKVIDTLGAGDTFIAGVIYTLNQEICIKDALEFGCRLAGMKCGIQGFDSLTLPCGSSLIQDAQD